MEHLARRQERVKMDSFTSKKLELDPG